MRESGLLFAPSQHTTQRCKADAARVAGSTGRVGAAKFAALTAAKKDAETVDETKKVLHNLVSLLQT
ncbi:hypothetical protein, partial [Cupriavidus sp. SK-4]|uniref:hypothetical protein n=1 Tax=Cupriavidus sp. SK-4 TaxID=574750 RepID=UPI001F23F69B